MKDRLAYQNYELLGRFLDGRASEFDVFSIQYGLCTPLCELVLVSINTMILIKTGKQ